MTIGPRFRRWPALTCAVLLGALAGVDARAGTYDYGTGAALAWAQGYTGQGQTIAVVDGGFDGSHRWFTGRIAGEACIVELFDAFRSPCPNGTRFETGPGSALVNVPREHWVDWMHGMKVAGTAVGAQSRELGFPEFARGIAPDARVLSVNSFSAAPTGAAGDVQVTDALRWVLERKHELNIVAVNLSFSSHSDYYLGPCDNRLETASQVAERNAIYELINQGVTVTASAGNYSLLQRPLRRGLRFPACLSRVLTVGAQDTVTRKRAGFSPTARAIDVMAPGTRMKLPYSASPGGIAAVTQNANGTSYSAPMVAGAVALYKQKNPNARPADIAARLMSTGPEVRLSGSETRRGLQVDALLGLRPVRATRAINKACFKLGFRPISIDRPNRMVPFVRLVCDPSSERLNRIALSADGPTEWDEDWRAPPSRAQEYYGENLVWYGKRDGIDTRPGDAYRLCWIAFPEDDKMHSESACEDFEA